MKHKPFIEWDSNHTKKYQLKNLKILLFDFLIFFTFVPPALAPRRQRNCSWLQVAEAPLGAKYR